MISIYARTPDNSLDIYVTGKQWMWHLQHPGGQREINTLHVPAGRTVKLIMTSEDVIHDFYVPAFRVKVAVPVAVVVTGGVSFAPASCATNVFALLLPPHASVATKVAAIAPSACLGFMGPPQARRAPYLTRNPPEMFPRLEHWCSHRRMLERAGAGQ